MSKSRKNPGREDKLKEYKNKNKKNKKMSDLQSNQPMGMPEVRQSPIWKSDEMLEISGAEWESIFNFIENSSAAFMAANAVMSRNIVNGKIKLKFDKLNKETFTYEDMTPEEEAPYQAEFQKAIEAAIAMQKKQENKLIVTTDDMKEEVSNFLSSPDQEGLPRLDAIVDEHGNDLGKSNNLTVV